MGKRSARYILYDVTSLTRDGDNLKVRINTSGGLEISPTGIQIKSGGVTDAMLAGNISFNKLADHDDIARLSQNEAIVGLWNFPDTSNWPTIGGKKISTQEYVDLMVMGLKTKGAARLLSDVNQDVTTGNLPTIDGVATADGDVVLLIGQTDAKQNGLWVVQSGSAWLRPDNYDVGNHAASAYAFVSEGTVYADTGWTCITDAPNDIIDTDDVTWGQFTGMGTITAGAGLGKNGNTIYVEPSQLLLNGNAEIDGDFIAISYVPTNYSRDTSWDTNADPEHLGSHLKGIDEELAAIPRRKYYRFTVSAGDIANKYKDIPDVPKDPNTMHMIIKQGGAMNYEDDFEMDSSTPNRLTWNGKGLDGVMATGDVVELIYSV